LGCRKTAPTSLGRLKPPCPFNSLFEMPSDNIDTRTGTGHDMLSILYLRCRPGEISTSTGPENHSFNSLFEMPAGFSQSSPRRPARLSILYLRCRCQTENTCTRFSTTAFQFSI